MYFDLPSAVGLPTPEPRVNLCPQQTRKMKGNGLLQGHFQVMANPVVCPPTCQLWACAQVTGTPGFLNPS